MKLPKQVTICGHQYKVTYKRHRAGGSGSMRTRKIVVGTLDGQRAAWEYLMHEIMELILCHRICHFTCGSEIRIMMTHAEFENFAADVATSLHPLLGD